jgi:hypothetical protein
MANEMWRIGLAVLVGAHGIGHILFLVPTLGLADWGQSTYSWLLTNLAGDGVTRVVGSLLWLAATLGFVAVVVGILGQEGWWPAFAAGSAALSLLGLALFWGHPTTSSAVYATLFDIAILGAVLWVRWPPTAFIGS